MNNLTEMVLLVIAGATLSATMISAYIMGKLIEEISIINECYCEKEYGDTKRKNKTA